MSYDAVVLAGGAARRMGGADKPALRVGGRTLLEHVIAAVPDAGRVIVVGPDTGLPGVTTTREDPPGGGPVPALRAGLALVEAPQVVLLAADLPFLRTEHVKELRAAGKAVLIDDDGREQWLTSVWPAAELRGALDGYPGNSLHGLLGPLDPVRRALPGRAWFDCDTMDDLEEAHMNVLTEWTALACKELGVDPARVDRDVILDLTKEVAHGVARPAAPLTAYLLGLAQGAGTAPEDAVARLTTLAHNWERATTETLTDG
ncbi:NTP transferase domain-containing protein [Nonomuraea sp. NPDC050556]|uniref:NTP transferase domain-containing protein n=1 Tax=Nonomuraea sp. NPDC050556 TaxID=3364369 RepID=UPI0037A79F1B